MIKAFATTIDADNFALDNNNAAQRSLLTTSKKGTEEGVIRNSSLRPAYGVGLVTLVSVNRTEAVPPMGPRYDQTSLPL